ncbi:hypothetical protein NIES4103_36490 [Nostoc sp. NIES-4103]|nr:hypothetical protein NIES4103_36490 [Nostoc sp. NIES-4103]
MVVVSVREGTVIGNGQGGRENGEWGMRLSMNSGTYTDMQVSCIPDGHSLEL